ncbi:UbiA-like polyprenyltransferase [Desulfohalovibrio reitneri]|uniref:UbiA-like polyprenyltransferase n=1 Tax=Desulfohalovibrio reitneri TaxID=1307759 RepID=UPI0004A717A0|nr:UbiA-like polyprenyltransferase [Desulfohalovibrio reitneri]
MLGPVRTFARMVKIEHSVFALPFAYTGLFWSADGWPGWRAFLLVTLAMVAVRSFAMAFNRIADLPFDRDNPRTRDRPLVTGEMSLHGAWVLTVTCAAVFVAACWSINPLVFTLSPIALVIAGGYSLTKRFTWLCHFVLGATLGLAPLGGWLAVQPAFAPAPVVLALGVTFWVAGFDILYAAQDIGFDRERGLNSLPARFGLGTALALSTFCHVQTGLFFLLAGWTAGAGWLFAGVMAVVALFLALEHLLISERDMSRVNLAFFTVNGVIALAVFAGALADIYWG